MKQSSLPLLLTLLLFAAPSVALGDGESLKDVAHDESPNAASDATFDKRLPPVLPGERVKDSGKTMRVWSTGGSVSVREPPAAPQAPSIGSNGELPENLSIIVDREREDHRSQRGSPSDLKGLREGEFADE